MQNKGENTAMKGKPKRKQQLKSRTIAVFCLKY